MNIPVSSGLMKRHARKALKGHWQTALLVSFSANILYTIASVMSTLNYPHLFTQLQTAVLQNQSPQTVFTQFENSGNGLISTIFYLIALLISPILVLGERKYFQNRMSDKESQYKDLFSRLNIFFKSLMLTLNVSLRIALWGLPPLLLLNALIFLFPNGISSNMGTFISVLISIGFAAVIILAIIRYSMSMFIMAKSPEKGVNEAIRESKAMMKTRKAQYLSRSISFIGWYVLIQISTYLLTIMFGFVVSITASMFFNLAFTVYKIAAYSVFYLCNTDAISVIQPANSFKDNQN